MLYAWDPKRVVTWPKTQNSIHECAERAEEAFDAPWKGFQAVPMNTESITPAASSCIDYMTASDSSFSQTRMNVPSGISSLAATEAGGLDHAGVGVDPTFFCWTGVVRKLPIPANFVSRTRRPGTSPSSDRQRL